MKKLMHKIGLGIVLFLCTTALTAKGKSVEKTKEIIESYTVTSTQKIEVDTKFGELKINTWDKNEVAVHVTIKVKDGNEKRAQEILDRIEIDITQTSNKLLIATNISGNDDEIKIKTSKGGYLEINYELTVPMRNQLSVTNSFGAFILDKMMANIKVDMKFGAATIGELNGDQNDLSFEFCDPVVINRFYKGKVKLKFAKLELLRSEDLTLTSEMSGSKIEKITKGNFYLKFGSLDLNEVKELKLESQMSTVNIESLHGSGFIKNKYGTLSIANVLPSATSLTVNGEFSPIKINLNNRGSYEVVAEAKMSGLKLPSGSVMNEQEVNEDSPAIQTTNNFNGRIGRDAEKQTKLRITSSFGDVKLLLTD